MSKAIKTISVQDFSLSYPANLTVSATLAEVVTLELLFRLFAVL